MPWFQKALPVSGHCGRRIQTSACHQTDKPKPIVESYATFSGARERKAGLKQAGYSVVIELSEPRESA
jgi:hypothetical protein